MQHGLAFQVFVKLTLRTILENQVDLIFIKEEAIELHNVWMSQVALDLNFTTQLMRDVTLEKLSLVQDF